MKKGLLFSLSFLIGAMAFAQTFVSTTRSTKNVLIEEFTGINCGYCPDGHRIVGEVMAAHPNNVFAINIHAGSFAANTYTTTDGEAIRANWGVTSFPAGMINRTVFTGSSPVYNRSYWSTYSNAILAQQAFVNIAARCTIDCDTRVATVTVELFYTDSSDVSENFLQVALLQNNILGRQSGSGYNPTQVINGQYNHMHMFRANMTGKTWGDTITATDSGSFVSKTYTYTLPATISNVPVLLQDVNILAFVTKSKKDVVNVCKASITYTNATPIISKMEALPFEGCTMEFPSYATVFNMGSDTIRTVDIKYGIRGQAASTYTRSGLQIFPGRSDTIHLPIMTGNFTSGTSYTGYAKITSANGTVINKDSVTCTLKKNQKDAAGGMLTFSLTTDRYGTETTYKFMKSDGTVLSSGGPYTNAVQTYTIALRVPEDGCYRLEVYDSEGDGINGGYGNGHFSLTDNNGTVFSDNGQFTDKDQYFLNITHTDGVLEAEAADFIVYPNPVKNTLHIESDENINKAEIFDMQGKMVVTDENANEINVSALPKGSYLVRITTEKGVSTRTFVKE